jgi:hypothetical protein
VTNQHHNHPDEDDHIKDHYCEYGSKKGSPEGPRMRQKATKLMIKEENNNILITYIYY